MNAPRTTLPARQHDRRFYSLDRAIGRFGMRIFRPQLMDAPHWHGHIEGNFILGADMLYDVSGTRVVIPEGALTLFWAAVPHRLVDLVPTGTAPRPRLINLYLPVDAFFLMPHISELQLALLNGGLVRVPEELCGEAQMRRWYGDYRAHDFERLEVVKMEINALFRRLQLTPYDLLHSPAMDAASQKQLSSKHTRHVVEMVRHILENLGSPMKVADVAAVVGLHPNYAMDLFSRTMGMSMKRFMIRMRLLRARALLTESEISIAEVALVTGFASISQFYDHFKRAFGIPPNALRKDYTAG